MRNFTIFIQNWILYQVLISILLLSFTNGSSPVEDMNFFRYSAKRLPNKISPSVTAVLMECPKASMTPSCQRKIMVDIRVSSEEQSNKRQKYLLLDEIYDQKKQTSAKLMSPYLIELTQGEPVLMYPLEFMKDFECKTCSNKVPKPSVVTDTPKSNTMPQKQSKLNVGHKETNEDKLMKHLQSLSRNHLNSNFKTHHRFLQNPVADGDDDERDTTLDLDSALDEGNSNHLSYRNIDQPQILEYGRSWDSVKRNPKNIEKLLFGMTDYDDASRNYDAMFDDLERKNEKIKKDILEILRPALQINDADLKNAGAAYPNQFSNRTDPSSPTSPAVNQQQEPPATTSRPPFSPCPTCPSLPPAVPSTPKPENDGKNVKPTRLERLQSIPDPSERFMKSLYGDRKVFRQGYAFMPNGLALLQRDDLPIQEISEDSSNSDDTDIISNEGADENQWPASEEAEETFTSIDEANGDPFVQRKQTQNDQIVKVSNFKSDSNAPFYKSSAESNQVWDQPLVDSLEMNQFKNYHFDPTHYDGPWFNKVDRYQSLMGKNKPVGYLSSPIKKKPHKKDTKFVSYSNGYGLNVDSTDLLNNSSLLNMVNYEHQPPMPRLQHYFMQENVPRCPHCGGSHDQFSSQMKRNWKKSISGICPYGKPFGTTRKISTSKINPVQKIMIDPSQNQKEFHKYSPHISRVKGIQDAQTNKIKESVAGLKGCGHTCSGNCDQSKCSSCGHGNAKLLSHEESQPAVESLSKYQILNDKGYSKNQDFNSRQDENGHEVNSVPLYINFNSKPSSSQWNGQSPRLTSEKFSGKSVTLRENNPHQTDEDGDDYDYYEEETNGLSGFPNVIATKPKMKYPGAYQRPVYIPEVPRESEDASPVFDESSPKNQQEKQNYWTHLKEREQHQNSQTNEHSQETQEDLTPAEMLLSQVDQTLLPDKVPYQSFMGDPNLNVRDKMRLMEMIDPYDSNLENLLKYLETEVQNFHIPSHFTKPESKEEQSQNIEDSDDFQGSNGHEKNIEKRSFLVYDDLEMRDTDLDYDDFTATKHVPAFDSLRESSDSHIAAGGSPYSKKSKNASGKSVEDIWYSVFNMSAPLQFLTTRVRIFRKKGNSWWKIVPSIALTSLSGIYANANLSILFSSHVEIYNLEKSLALKNYRLFIPKNHTNITSSDIFAINESKFHYGRIETDESVHDIVCNAAFDKITASPDGVTNLRKRNQQNDSVHSLQDLGYFPSTMNILEQCKNDSNHLCLNMLDEDTPGYRMKVEIPFRDNSLLYKDFFKVRITSITADGTINGAVQIVVSFINEALLSQGFDIMVANCPVTCGEKNVVHKVAPPHRSVTVAFLLPMEDNDITAKHHCEVQIKTSSNHIIARRSMIVQPSARCLCIWQCDCHCVKENVATSIIDMCRHLTYSEETDAGFEDAEKSALTWKGFVFWMAIFLMLLMLLGCVKACLGCCLAVIGSWKYNYLQPMKKYDEASRSRRFFINSLFFLCFPFVCLCQCFQPSEEDMLKSTANWECSVKQHRIDSSDYDTSETEEEFKKEKIAYEQNENRTQAGAESGYTEAYTTSAQEYLFETYHDEEEVKDTNYVLTALNESRETIQKIDVHCSEELSSHNEQNIEATENVRNLLAAKIVYRTFKVPVGNANIPPGQAFAIRGYFIPAVGPGYQFITHSPLRQHWRVCPDIHSLRPIIPPSLLLSKDFSRSYANKLEVMQAGDLSICPYITAPCINVLVQDISMYMRPDEDKDDDVYDGSDLDE